MDYIIRITPPHSATQRVGVSYTQDNRIEKSMHTGIRNNYLALVDEYRPAHAISFSITDQDHQYGVLIMGVTKGTRLETWQKQLLEAVARHIGIAINISRRATESRRLALLEERSVIARKLHDSLAQSLSYLKIQVTRLDAALNESENDQTVRLILKELRDGLSSAYRQLRELLTTFRLKVDGRALREGPQPKTVDEAGLTEREREIVKLIANGFSNKRIARALDITEGTVKVHVKHLLKKLNLSSRVEAAVWAVKKV